MRLLLLSNSSNYDAGYLDHAAEEIAGLFSGVRRVLFVPFALRDHRAYGDRARDRLARLGLEVDLLEEGPAGRDLAARAEGIFVGGGNTFRLLHRLQRSGLLDDLRRRALAGVPYLGASAGTVIAAPTIKTTNDMPIVQPASLESLDLVPFQINCHYLDADPASTHMGETRETRLLEFLEENDAVVVALREGAMLRVEGDAISLLGASGARIFRRGAAPVETAPGSPLDDLLAPPPRRP